jgi:hypothetical protein
MYQVGSSGRDGRKRTKLKKSLTSKPPVALQVVRKVFVHMSITRLRFKKERIRMCGGEYIHVVVVTCVNWL